ncbi:hypothetical protein BH11PSE9_BH11PSE9_29110 [soil metagenome]
MVDPRGRLPSPGAELHLSMTTWPRGQAIHRIHLSRYAPASFNPGLAGNARFSPIAKANGEPVPTLYGGTSFDCAAMETVFHDVPFAAGFKSYDKRRLQGHLHSLLQPTTDLLLVDLSAIALRKLGVQRGQLIDTEKDCYPQTRAWAQAIHAQHARAQCLCWISRQDDRAEAVMLFGDRVKAAVLAADGASRPLLLDAAAYADLVSLARRIGVNLL